MKVKKNMGDEIKMRRFVLYRIEDVSGVSGTGTVAEGVEFVNGMVALSWISPYSCVNVYQSMRALEEVHGHEQRTLVKWIDKNENEIEAED